MNEQHNLEKTLTILKNKLEQAQQQYKQTKKTIHTKKAFLLSSKSLLQQDFQHAFLIKKRKYKPKTLLSTVPSGLLPLISTKVHGFKKKESNITTTTLLEQHIKVISCIGIIIGERIWFRTIINNSSTENIAQANMTLMPINWISFEILRSTLHNISALSNHILYAAMMVPPNLSPEKLASMDLKSSCKYMLENGNWLESEAISIQWINKKDDQYKQWMIDDIDKISTWAPIYYPHKIHLSYSDLLNLKDWIRLDKNIFITPDKSLLFIKSDNLNTLSPIHSHLFGLKEQTIASWLYKTKLDKYMIPYDGYNIDTYQRLKNIIISLMDLQTLSSESSSYNHLINRENSIVQLSSLIP
ncbi:unnamed protein product [Cunninghamella blakesleeana]